MPDSTQNGNGTSPTEEFRIPDFVTQLIGRLQLENEALRIQVQMFQMQQAKPAVAPEVPEQTSAPESVG